MKLSDNVARQRALSPHESFIIEAGAGSGKTEQLKSAVLSKLAVSEVPENVVALSFTNKSALEMKERIHNSLVFASTNPCPTEPHRKLDWELAKKVLERDSKFNWNLISNPNRLQVTTIDSLCASIVKQLPLTSGMGGAPMITDDPQSIYKKAVIEMLNTIGQDVPWSKSLSVLFKHMHNDSERLIDLLVSLLGQRDQWEPIVFRNESNSDLKSSFERTLIDNINASISSAPIGFTDLISSLDELLTFSMKNLGLDINNMSHAERYKAYSRLLRTSSGTIRKSITARDGFPAPSSINDSESKKIAKKMKDLFSEISKSVSSDINIVTYVHLLSIIPTNGYTDQQWEVLSSMLDVLPVLSGLLNIKFNELSVCDYIAVTQAASSSFHNEVADVALMLDHKIHHLLIDEFQDTSVSHYRFVESIITTWMPGDGRSLFLTGDKKQSVYSFRESDVSLFIRVKMFGIGNLKPTSLELTTNFRSEAPIVEWVNASFCSILPKEDNVLDSSVSYTASVPFHKATTTNQPVSMFAFRNSSDEDEINHIAELIASDRSNYPLDTTAVLVRTRSLIPTVVNALKSKGVPVCALEVGSAINKSYIRDLIALSVCLVDPHDKDMLAVLLTSSFVGLSFVDLETLFSFHDNSSNAYVMLSHSENEFILSGDGHKKTSRIFSILELFKNNRYRKSDADLIEGVWRELGGASTYPEEQDLTKNTTAFFSILRDTESKGLSFTADSLERRAEILVESAIDVSDNPVQIMTIHKSKGLEFHSVYIPCLAKQPRNQDKPILAWRRMVDDFGNDQTMLAPIELNPDHPSHIYEYLLHNNTQRIHRENARLLYVGCTRPIKKLTLSASLKFDEDTPKDPPKGSLIYPMFNIFVSSSSVIDIKTNNKPSSMKVNSRSIISREFINTWTKNTSLLDTLSLERIYPDTLLDSTNSRLSGLALHKVLELIFTNKLLEPQKIHQIVRSPLISLLRDNGVLNESVDSLFNSLAPQIDAILSSSFINQLISIKDAVFCAEKPILSMRNGRVENGFIDLTIETLDTIYIIDWKFVFPSEGESLSQLSNRLIYEYESQLTRYYSAVSKYTDKSVCCFICNPVIDLHIDITKNILKIGDAA